MSSTITGSCYCGACAYQVTDVSEGPQAGIICHCKSCQKLHTFQSYNVAFPKEALTVTKGKPSVYIDTQPDNGSFITRSFCGDCGSAIFSHPDSMRDKVLVKAGTLDDLSRVEPQAEIYMERAVLGTSTTNPSRKTKLYNGMMAKEIN